MASILSFTITLKTHHHRSHLHKRSNFLKPFNPITKTTLSFTTSTPNLIPNSTPQDSNPTLLEPSPILETTLQEPSFTTTPIKTTNFLTPKQAENLEKLENFYFLHTFPETGHTLLVRVMREEEMDDVVGLLSESFAQSVSVPFKYVQLLRFVVKGYMMERQEVVPDMATLVGFYEGEDGVVELAGTVEVSFNERGGNDRPPSPVPPKEAVYICNMTVKEALRRRRIGWHLLKACEELILQMECSNEVYLHCRMIDKAPYHMYTKAGYNVMKTDNIFVLLFLQRRKYLMCKKLPVPVDFAEDSDEYSVSGIST